ncbi:low-density lipoprotein receptor class A domain-containing protein 3-like [Aethina tumida]|uniref:low-density lipoprotein receptor class A domain-containing protein 3-like n=1 Tax=Aethina tumida TaxID=116153 RepID=UPI00096B39A2|nr:low-density lipoprotein receptor class A domain-containing protein 3-like [Aethina tumida]
MKMTQYLVYFLVLGLCSLTKCELSLQIIKDMEGTLTPVSKDVYEKVNTKFSLICELEWSGDPQQYTEYDENLQWSKEEKTKLNMSLLLNRYKPITTRNAINKATKVFNPLRIEDKGTYFCVSLKFKLFKTIDLNVYNDVKRVESRPLYEPNFCNDQMFQCMSNGVCITQHYVCDGKADCKDRSDESPETCQGDPCKDKIPCDDGRCIPISWCCDRNHDLNCTVTNRPQCCQVLSESYEEYGFTPHINQPQEYGATYLFILVCVLSILFSIVLLLLILSKVVIFAKKTALQQQRQNFCENALRNQNGINLIQQDCDIYSFYRNSRTPRSNYNTNIVLESTSVNDPLLCPPRFNTDLINDQPPSYIDVLRHGSVNDPPPPYASREMLNLNDVGRTGAN